LDVAAWLRELGLERYAQAFLDNDIAPAVLAELTDQDLKDLGVSLGHRRLLLKAIKELQGRPPVPPAPAKPSSAAPEPATRPEAERRQLTVLFCDLVGSTALAGRLDPEDMSAVIRAYQNAVAGETLRFEGHVAKFMGDGVLAYFGWPKAHEDDAERAVRAGLALVRAVAELAAAGQPLAARIGIATGPVVVGDLIGEGEAQERAVVGETPNLAARLQALADPGSVVISQATRRLVGRLFALSDLGPQRLKGFVEPLAAFRVDGEGRAEGRFEALHGERLTPLVGREHELGILLERWAWARDGDGQMVLLTGEPGIGKSRLVRALREHLGEEPYTSLSHYCSPYHTNSALYPVIGLLERAARLDRDDPPEAQLAKLEALLARSSDRLDGVVPLFAALLGVPTGDRYPALALTPEVQKRRTLQALIEQLAGLATHQSVLALYEDAHWVDPSTLELLSLVVERIRQLPVLALLTLRPEFQPPWTSHAHITTLTMSRLGRRQGTDLVARVTGEKPLPAEIVEQIVARTDGVPLFVEELTRTVLESGLLTDAGDRYELAGPLAPFAIPTTLQDSLMARLDRLGPVKEVAQISAVIGREFSHDLLAAVADRPEPDLETALDQLVAAELIFRRGIPPEATYRFKHALVQDAAYQSLLKSKRHQLHHQIAVALEERFPSATAPEVLAHHYSEAGLVEPAIGHWRRAGERAVRRAANREAIQHFRRALDLLKSLPETPARDQLELKISTQLGPALMLVNGWAAPAVEAVYTRARQLAHSLQRSGDLVPPLVGLWLFYLSRGRYDGADEITDELFQVAEATKDADLLLQAHHAAWPLPMLRGNFAESYGHIAKGIELYDPERHKQHAFLYMGHDPAVCAHALGAGVVWALGRPEQARAHADDAIQFAHRMRHPPTLAFALWLVGVANAAAGDSGAALSTAEQLLKLSEEQELPQTRASALVIAGWAMAQADQIQEGLKQLRAGLADWHRMGIRSYLQVFTCLLAESCMRAGRYAEALEYLAQAFAIGEETGERWWEARIHRTRGQVLLHAGPGNRDEATMSFQSSIQIARAQGAKSLELRAAISLARLWADQGRRIEAQGLLAPVYDWFTEGFGTADLKEAKALLEELR
jgi:class 3 adenylate cyclase/predicted ATPase